MLPQSASNDEADADYEEVSIPVGGSYIPVGLSNSAVWHEQTAIGQAAMYRQWSRLALRALLIGVAILCAILGSIAIQRQKGAQQQRFVSDLLQFDSASVIALYGEYEYRPPPNIDLGDGLSLVLGGGQRLNGFSVRDEPTQYQRFFESILGAHAITQVSIVFWQTDEVTDADLRMLNKAPQLRELYLDGASITDAGISQIIRMQHLVVLGLSDTGVTVDGVQQLTACPNLRELDLRGTEVDDEVIRTLKESLPHCSISW